MKIAYVADARSPIAQNWIRYFIERGHEVTVISTYPCETSVLPGAKIITVPIAFSRLAKVGHDGTIGAAKRRTILTPLIANLRSGPASQILRNVWLRLAPLELSRHVGTVRHLLADISPDLVHAMRIPFEGILAAKAKPSQIPLLISVWGNDFTLQAKGNPLIARQTRHAMRQTDALHCDCRRDLHLAGAWNFHANKPSLVVPGTGGVQTDLFYPGACNEALRQELKIPQDAPVVINPRGYRPYVCNKAFFEAMPAILAEQPATIFLCSAMQGNSVVEKWMERLNISANVRLLPLVRRDEMADLFRMSQITVSPSLHDGTPNTLLEAMACGCFPVAGNIESVREWITDGQNGLLFDPRNPEAIARAILHGLDSQKLRDEAATRNLQLIAERAEYRKMMQQAEKFYQQLAEHSRSGQSMAGRRQS